MDIEKSVRNKKFTYFIGIDVSRNELDYAVIQGKKFLFHKEASNNTNAIFQFIEELKKLPNFTISKSMFCMENTGIYCNHLLVCLKKIKANVVLENALQIKNSLGLIRGKYDKIDAIRIAQYAVKNHYELRLWVERRPKVQQIAALFALRYRMLGLQVALKTPLKEQATFVIKKIKDQSETLCKKSIEAIKGDIQEIDLAMDTIISNDDYLLRIFEIITSVPNIGRITALEIIITTNEYKSIRNPKKFACYSGIAPFKSDSGVVIKKAKVSSIANKRVKSFLHICAIGAVSRKGDLRDYYVRKTKIEGKPRMVVINAIRYKLILRVFACLNQNRLYEKNYIRISEFKQT